MINVSPTSVLYLDKFLPKVKIGLAIISTLWSLLSTVFSILFAFRSDSKLFLYICAEH